MNGKKILVTLIWFFMGINIILFVANYMLKEKEYKVSTDRIENIEQVLEKQGITIECELPRIYEPKVAAELSFAGASVRYTVEKNFFGNDLVSVKHSVGKSKENPLSDMKVQYCTFNNEVLAFDGNALHYENKGIVFDENGTEQNAHAACNALIKRIDPNRKESYRIVATPTDEGWQIMYYPLLDNVPVEDSYMIFKVCKSGVLNATMYLSEMNVVNTEKREVVAIDLVLFNLIDYLKTESVEAITNVELVYKDLPDNSEMWEEEIVPAYKITAKGLDQPLFVNAYTNEIIK